MRPAGLAGPICGQDSLEHLLTEVATFAMMAVPGDDAAGVTMLEPDTIVASAQFVRDVDSIQYRLGEGPCISAAATGLIDVAGHWATTRHGRRSGRRRRSCADTS